jgi:hypothetical protein
MIQIDEMVIRVPGLNEEEGRRLGEDVAQFVAGRLPAGLAGRHIAALNIKLPYTSDQSQLAAIITEQILQQLKSATL